MSGKLTAEINSIKSELLSIAGEVEGISAEIRRDYEGIGNERCARSLDSLGGRCRDVKKRLDNFDYSWIDAQASKRGGFSGGGGGGGGGHGR